MGKDITSRQFHWPQTNVLVTRLLGPHGAAELTDFMPAGAAVSGDGHVHQLIRRVTAVRGSLTFCMECRPAFNYARDAHTTDISGEGAAFSTPALTLGLASGVALAQENGAARNFPS